MHFIQKFNISLGVVSGYLDIVTADVMGVSFALLGMKPFPAVLMIGLITFLCSAAGVKMGSLFGNRFEGKAELAGGAVLILIGVRILAEGLLG